MEEPSELKSRIFGALPPDLFRVFSGPARWFYADLLEQIDRTVFGDFPTVISRHEMTSAIRDFIDRRGYEVQLEDDATGQSSSELKARIAYRRLLDTGWLTEFRDRYRRVVDMNANARLVLTTLLEIKAGRTRSYGGEVLQVLLQLEGADKDPEHRSEAIRNASKSARSFMHHLRSISGAVRQIEEELVGQTDMRTLFRKFFEDFVEHFLIADFKQLKSTTNPFAKDGHLATWSCQQTIHAVENRATLSSIASASNRFQPRILIFRSPQQLGLRQLHPAELGLPFVNAGVTQRTAVRDREMLVNASGASVNSVRPVRTSPANYERYHARWTRNRAGESIVGYPADVRSGG